MLMLLNLLMLFNVESMSKYEQVEPFCPCLALAGKKPDTFTGLAGASILRVAHEGRR
jgi:hypothetical protein